MLTENKEIYAITQPANAQAKVPEIINAVPAAAAPMSASNPAASVRIPAVDLVAIEKHVLSVVSEKTGYPPEMLDLELDLEADLGVDTVKQA
jgi:hypothetical protein